MSYEFCDRDPGCVWPKGHPGDVHCHTFGAADPMVATQDDADREIEALRKRVRELEADLVDAMSRIDKVMEDQRRIEEAMVRINRAKARREQLISVSMLDDILSGRKAVST